ncbi:restriction endonuclease subunit S [Rhizobium sp. WSM4643]|uniref:restriction endonuclease subunit S n=1 Tax=Rhizobium TaxID=379 RepID=UPI0021A64A03|nr:restriction endonuclease subunit S [Rhizobium leguminosarum]UWM76364.1 restriction endonuclease subunit S [Rhizobium leguminosarum bv. viciae]
MSFGEAIADLVDQSLDPILQTAKSWQRVPLAEVVDILNGYPWPSSGFSADRGQPVIRIRNVLDGETSTFYEGEIVDGYWIFPGDLLVGMDGDFNRNFWKGPKALLNQRVCKLSIKRGFYDERFLYHVLPGYLGLINKHTSSVTVKHLSSKTLGEIPLPLPPLAEQKRIVAKLDALNAKSTRARIELARIETLVSRYKQAVLSKAFSGELTREWRARVKATEPRIGKLEELLSVPVRNGLSVRGSDTPPGFPALRLSALREREVRLDDVRYIPVDDDKARRFLLETGDILVSRGNGTRSLVGIASLVPTVVRPTIFPDTAFRIRVDYANALPLWLTSLWNAPQVRSQIELVAKTTAGIWKISQKDLATIQLSIPSTVEEQHEIVRRIESAFAKIDRLAGQAKRALELVGRLDEAILAKAFGGELVPQDENDEPASSLLEKIKQIRISQPAESKRTAPARKGKVPKMARSILETLVQAKDWLSAQELFARCGVRNGSSTEDVEKLYRQLLDLERQEKVEIEEVVDPASGAKQGDRVRLRK